MPVTEYLERNAKLYGDEAVQASLPSFRAVFGEAVME